MGILWRLSIFLLAVLVLLFFFLYLNERRFIYTVTSHYISQTSNKEEAILETMEWVTMNTHEVDFQSYAEPLRSFLRIYYRLTPISPSALENYVFGYYKGPCGGRSRLMVLLLQEQGISSNRLLVWNNEDTPDYMHSIVEAQPGDGFRGVYDPTYNLAFRRLDGQPANKKDLRDRSLVRYNLLNNGINPSFYDKMSFENTYYLNFARLPGGLRLREVLRRAGVNVNELPGIPFYDNSYLFLVFVFLFGVFLLILFRYLAIRVRSRAGSWVKTSGEVEVASSKYRDGA
jgi:hypothetical protein